LAVQQLPRWCDPNYNTYNIVYTYQKVYNNIYLPLRSSSSSSSRARSTRDFSRFFIDLPIVRRPIYKWVSQHNIINTYTYDIILCTSTPAARCANGQYSIGAIDDTISGVQLVGPYGSGGGDTITRFSV